MDYLEISKAIQEYEAMTSEEIQNELKPIIKSYDKDFLVSYLGTSKENLNNDLTGGKQYARS